MQTYRLYFVDKGAGISGPPVLIKGVNDHVATQKARNFLNDKDIKLWRQGQLVALISRR